MRVLFGFGTLLLLMHTYDSALRNLRNVQMWQGLLILRSCSLPVHVKIRACWIVMRLLSAINS